MKIINNIAAGSVVILVGLPLAAVIKLASAGKPANDNSNNNKPKDNPWQTARLKLKDFRQALMPETPGEPKKDDDKDEQEGKD